jgi:hypothetical protein
MFSFTTPAMPALACAMLAALAGCQSVAANASLAQTPAPAIDQQAAQQLIIKFKPSARGDLACDSAGIARLAAATRTRLEFMRPMSGQACVVRQAAPGAAELAQGLARLKRHPAVEWADIDAVMKAL